MLPLSSAAPSPGFSLLDMVAASLYGMARRLHKCDGVIWFQASKASGGLYVAICHLKLEQSAQP